MKIKHVSEEDLEAWRNSPAADAIRECLTAVYDTQKKMCLDAYWAGNPWAAEDVKALQYQYALIGEVFEATKEDMMAVMEQIDEKSIRLDAD